MSPKHFTKLEYPTTATLTGESYELLPCPWCGAIPEVNYFTAKDGSRNQMCIQCPDDLDCPVSIQCTETGALFDNSEDEKTDRSVIDKLVTRWNQRSEAK